MSMAWTERVNEQRENVVIDDIHSYMEGTADSGTLSMDHDEYLGIQRERLHDADRVSVIVIEGLFALALAVMLINYYSMRRWEQKATEERDQALLASLTDSMTGVRNKHAFAIKESELEAKIVEDSVENFGIVVGDVNGLKRINDTLGHKAGDEYICAASRMLCDYYKHSPVFRIGGDEFVMILQGQDYDNRDSILSAIDKEIEGNIGSNNVVISLGMTVYERGVDESFHEVFKRADDLMYKRKEQLKSMGAVVRD
jgi:diguanylate cyclase (GGDEF)-like protein